MQSSFDLWEPTICKLRVWPANRSIPGGNVMIIPAASKCNYECHLLVMFGHSALTSMRVEKVFMIKVGVIRVRI